MSSTRQRKYEGLIQKDLSEIFQKDSRHWFGNAFITVTGVDISPDLSFAKVFLSTMMVDDPSAFVESMKGKKGEIRKALGLKIGKQVRIVPDLAFYLDETMANAQRMEKLLADLNIPPADDEDKSEG
ncbi:MAG: 30S ribosome-binding factor RbfA [Reichenbachiella sp.]